jgi:hypothetical protein
VTAVAGGLDGGALVDDAFVVEEEGAPGVFEGEAEARGAPGVEDPGLAALDMVASHQQHRHEVDAIAVGPLGGRSPDALRRVDAKLVDLDGPGGGGAAASEERAEGPEQGQEGRMVGKIWLQGGEPALDAAVERVVLGGLEVGPGPGVFQEAAVQVEDEAPVTAGAVAPPVQQVTIRGEPRPEVTEPPQGPRFDP